MIIYNKQQTINPSSFDLLQSNRTQDSSSYNNQKRIEKSLSKQKPLTKCNKKFLLDLGFKLK